MKAPVALLIVSYGSGEEIAKCLGSLDASTVQPARILIADNLCDGNLSSQLRSPSEVEGRSPSGVEGPWSKSIEIHEFADNPGYGGAINRLIAELPTQGIDWLLVVNPDVTFEATTLAELIAGAQQSGIGSVGPRILDENGYVYPSARQVPSIRTGVGHALFGKLWPSNPWTAKYLNANEQVVERDAGWLSGACVMVRREAFDSVGGFDDEFFMYFEDVDLGYRLGQAGWLNRYVPDAVVHHSGGHSTKDRSAAMRAAHHHSAELFLKRRYPGPLGTLVRWPLAIGLRLRAKLIS